MFAYDERGNHMRTPSRQRSDVEIGYGVDASGHGIVYARSDGSLLRLPFRIVSRPAALDRAAGYAAIVTVARSLTKRGIVCARLRVPDLQLVEELTKRTQPPDDLTLGYVRVRCALNAMEHCDIEFGRCEDLMQRARAEVALNSAA